MKILLVTPLFPPDKGVSTLRAKFFHDACSLNHQIDVLKLGTTTNLVGRIKTVDKTLFSTLFRTLVNKKKIKSLLLDTLKTYDCIIVSAPPYSLYTIGNIATACQIPVIYDYRDQPDLIYYDKTKNRPWNIPHRWILLQLLEKYIYNSFGNAYAVLCVGQTSTSLLQTRLKRLTNIHNCHNGYLEADSNQLTNSEISKNPNEIVIGWSGSIYDFRDSDDLRDVLQKLDTLSKTRSIRLIHWGTINKNLGQYIEALTSLQYQPMPPIERPRYLDEIAKTDALLLSCSASLIWEPTTTVFDYLLLNKPVIFTGLRNNEAYQILNTSGMNIVTAHELESFRWIDSTMPSTNQACKQIFSREHQFKIVEHLLKNLENKPNDY